MCLVRNCLFYMHQQLMEQIAIICFGLADIEKETGMKVNFKRLWLFVPLGFLGLLYLFVSTRTGHYINCPFHRYLGIECPGCGATRMVIALLHLDFYQAFRYNPLIFILMPGIFIMISFLFGVIEFEAAAERIYVKCVEMTGLLAIVYFIMRNIPLFYFLRPTVVG